MPKQNNYQHNYYKKSCLLCCGSPMSSRCHYALVSYQYSCCCCCKMRGFVLRPPRRTRRSCQSGMAPSTKFCNFATSHSVDNVRVDCKPAIRREQDRGDGVQHLQGMTGSPSGLRPARQQQPWRSSRAFGFTGPTVPQQAFHTSRYTCKPIMEDHESM